MNEREQIEKGQLNYITIDGVKFFGEVGEAVKPEEIENIKPTLDNELYILKHYNNISEEERERLLGKEAFVNGKKIVVDESFINGQLRTAGSKFNSSIEAFSTPEKALELAKKYLLKKIEEGENLQWLIKGKARDLVTFIDINNEIKEAEGIPLDQKIGASPLVEITPELAENVASEMRGENDRYNVNKIKGMPAPEIDKLIIALRWYPGQDAPKFNSLYPGLVAPAFPNKERQTPEEAEFNQKFWDQHAFIEE